MSARALICGALALALIGDPCAAQEAASSEKDDVALAAARQALDAARQKQLLDALAAVKQTTEGKAAVTDAAATAEGLLVGDVGMRSAALKMADQVVTWRSAHTGADKPLLVVLGAQAPSIAQWQAFDRASLELKERLGLVAKDWATVTGPAPGGGGGTKLGTFIAPLAGVTLVTTLASLLKMDFGIAGTRLAPSSDATRAIVIWALSARAVPLKLPDLAIAGEPTGVKSRLDELAPLQKTVAGHYHDDYLKRLAASGGKPDKLDAAVAAAGANLATALADYDALVKTLYTPAGSSLPAVEIERQRLIAGSISTQPVLYVTSFSAALTAVTKKGLFTGIRSTPASLRVAGTIDFVIALDQSAEPRRAVYLSPTIAFDQAAAFRGDLPGDP